MVRLLTIFFGFWFLVTGFASAETIKVTCEIVQPTAFEKKLAPTTLVFDTKRKTVRHSDLPEIKVSRWDRKRIVWFHDGEGFAVMAVYHIESDLLKVHVINELDFNPDLYPVETVDKPELCRRSTF